MSLGLIGKKQGMTRVFTQEGKSFPVTVVSIDPNVVTQVKTTEKDGYSSIQVTTGEKKEKHLNKAKLGHFRKSSVNPGEGLWEFKIDEVDIKKIEVGQSFSQELFKEGQVIDVSGVSKGKGFAGTVKRWNFKMQDATHGNSLSHRAPGSIGQCQTPGRVWKGKKMSGHMGFEKVTVQNLKIVSIDNNMILVQGSIPGATGSRVLLRPSRGQEVEFSSEGKTLEGVTEQETPSKEAKKEETPSKEAKKEESSIKEGKKTSKKKE